MLAVKLHLLATIVITQAIAVNKGAVPYFPIEISRTAASYEVAGATFTAGILTLTVTLVWTAPTNCVTFGLWLGLVIVALVPDTVSVWLHMAGVAIVFMTTILHIYLRSATETWQGLAIPIAWAIGIFALRIIVRSLVLFVFARQFYRFKTYADVLEFCLTVSRNLMFYGRNTFPEGVLGDEAWAAIKPTMQICGVLQWVAFYALSLSF